MRSSCFSWLRRASATAVFPRGIGVLTHPAGSGLPTSKQGTGSRAENYSASVSVNVVKASTSLKWRGSHFGRSSASTQSGTQWPLAMNRVMWLKLSCGMLLGAVELPECDQPGECRAGVSHHIEGSLAGDVAVLQEDEGVHIAH